VLNLLGWYLADVDIEEQVADPNLSQCRNLLCNKLWRASQEGMLDQLVGTRRCPGVSRWETSGVISPARLVEVVAIALQALVATSSASSWLSATYNARCAQV
jgi:hypothetical protein